MEKMTKVELYQVLIGLIAAMVWAFGKNWNLPADMISFAGNAVVAVAGHAIGLNAANTPVSNDPNVPK
jgi:ammonia channel protein AmtB